VNRTEQSAKSPSASTGLFATLRASTSAKGTRAPSRTLITTLLTLAALALTAAPAFAAPEKPEALPPTEVKATTASLQGILSPKAPGEPGSFYKYIYKASKTKVCTGGSETTAGIALGAEHEVLPSEPVTGLTAGTEYAVCLLAENAAKTERTTSTAITFTTATPPEPPEASTAKEVTTTTATLEATINPHKEAVTGYYVAYSDTGKCTEGSTTEPVAPAKLASPTKVTVPLTGLEPVKNYEACLIASNEAGETASGAEVPFTTAAVPATIESESVSNITSSEATLEGAVNPNNQFTECHFQYGTGSVSESEVPCTPELLKGYGEQSVGPRNGEGNPQPVGGLSPGSEYHYRIITKNGKGEVGDGPEQSFKTAEEPEKQAPTELHARSATLNGVLQPHNPFEAGTYEFVYESSETECMGAPGPHGEVPYKTVPVPAAASAGATPEPVQAAVTGLHPGDTYTFCLLLRNATGSQAAIGAQETFTTPAAAPVITSESVSHVEATQATLQAQIEPDGAATSYVFEYGPSETYGTTTKATALPEDGKVEAVIPEAGVLASGATYHYRVTAVNEVAGTTETVHGEDKTFTTPAASGATPETCPNAARRGEQPAAAALPDCRAYEMVSPADTNGQDATFAENPATGTEGLRSSLAGNAIAYAAPGVFAEPSGSGQDTEYLSRRESGGWSTQAITPLQETLGPTPGDPSFTTAIFTPELEAGVASTTAALPGTGAPENPVGTIPSAKLYVAQFGETPADPSYTYVGPASEGGGGITEPTGASTDLSHVVFGTLAPAEWVNGTVSHVGVTNAGEALSAIIGSSEHAAQETAEVDTWHAVSADGSRVVFTSPGSEKSGERSEPPGQLYVRVHAEQPQSPIASPEANGTGTLTAGSNMITPLAVAEGSTAFGAYEGETVLSVTPGRGRFVVGGSVSGPAGAIAPGTTITEVTQGENGHVRLTLSAAVTGYMPEGSPISSGGPAPFAVGQPISGDGIPKETTVTAVAAGELTLSKPAASSGSGVELRAGGGCTEPPGEEACTIDVSASQRLGANPAGIQPARFWGASTGAPGGEAGAQTGGPERVFFTSDAELTEDAYTGPHGEGANLYECELVENDTRCVLSDLTGEQTDSSGGGAAVQGVVQISADGSYVYFVATGALTGKSGEPLQNGLGEAPQQGEPNLYVSHDGGAPVFIATLAHGDEGDWNAGGSHESGPDLNTAAIDPSGTRLAFSSTRPLKTVQDPAGYDNRQAAAGECEPERGACREVFLYDAGSDGAGSLTCASCNPSGARPHGPSTLGQSQDASQVAPSYRRRNLSESGVLFFDSWDALGGATGGVENVYEYENGVAYPISDTASGSASFLMDASANGSDVFFATDDRLLPSDTGGELVVYDARVNGGFPASVAPTLCAGEGCRAPASSQPTLGAPASSTYSGPPNPTPPAPPVAKPKTAEQLRIEKLDRALKTCRKDKKKSKRQACEKQAHKKYAKKASAKKSTKARKSTTANRANNDRRAGR
jgi:hypothetical protein